MIVFIDFSAQVHDVLAHADFDMQEIHGLMVVQSLFHRASDCIILLLNLSSTACNRGAHYPDKNTASTSVPAIRQLNTHNSELRIPHFPSAGTV
jgi:hypothetical protein